MFIWTGVSFIDRSGDLNVHKTWNWIYPFLIYEIVETSLAALFPTYTRVHQNTYCMYCNSIVAGKATYLLDGWAMRPINMKMKWLMSYVSVSAKHRKSHFKWPDPIFTKIFIWHDTMHCISIEFKPRKICSSIAIRYALHMNNGHAYMQF